MGLFTCVAGTKQAWQGFRGGQFTQVKVLHKAVVGGITLHCENLKGFHNAGEEDLTVMNLP